MVLYWCIAWALLILREKKDITIIKFIFRCINEGWFPKSFSIEITDDRENKYSAMDWQNPFRPSKSSLALSISFNATIGSTWLTTAIVKIPIMAPIYKFELLPYINDAPGELKTVYLRILVLIIGNIYHFLITVLV
jgi:hypothetical protein